MAFPLAAAIAAPIAGSLIGGILGKKAADKADQTNRDLNYDNTVTQREFAQHGVRWKVEDAKAAGIHPLVALGANTASFSPSSIGSAPDNSMADMAKNMGQDVGRAIQSTRTSQERTITNLQIQGAQLDIEGKALDNQIKNSQLRKLNAPGGGPPTPSPASSAFISGQGDPGKKVIEKPLERTMSLAGSPHAEPGAVSDVGWAKTRTGIVPIPSNDIKQRIEDNMPQEFMHYYRNNITPNWGSGTKPPDSALPEGHNNWYWHHGSQEYRSNYVSPQERSDVERYKSRIKSWFGR